MMRRLAFGALVLTAVLGLAVGGVFAAEQQKTQTQQQQQAGPQYCYCQDCECPYCDCLLDCQQNQYGECECFQWAFGPEDPWELMFQFQYELQNQFSWMGGEE